MAIWDDILTERDKQVFSLGGYGKRGGFGKKPVLMIVDVNYNFIGDKPEPILESIKRWRHSCGEEGWEAVHRIKELLDIARQKKVPVIYTTGEKRVDDFDSGRRKDKNFRAEDSLKTSVEGHIGTKIVDEIAPLENEVVISKKKPSAFFCTPLISHLIDLGADTLIITGCTTSGCVRSTVIDGQSYNFKMIVVEEGVFDRGQASHKISLFDMNAKYADVVSLNETKEYLLSLT